MVEVKKTIQKLRDKSFWILQEDGTEVLVSWLSKIKIKSNKGVIKLKLDEDLKPYLLKLKGLYTQFNSLYLYAMKKGVTPRLYEFFKSYQFKQSKFNVVITLHELKKLFDMLEKFPLWSDFKRYVIEPSVNEINSVTDFNVTYQPIRKGKAIYKICFSIIVKNEFEIGKLENDIFIKMSNKQSNENDNKTNSFIEYNKNKIVDIPALETEFAKNLWKTNK